jgi:CubicO group peptidase (beta-lactamase class C family)
MQASRRHLLLGAAGLGVAACATARPRAAAPQAPSLRAVAQTLMQTAPAPALSCAVYRGDQLLWAEAFGMADIELNVAALPAHRFRLGSVSKVVTASLAVQLRQRGAVDLDAPIATYLPDLPQQHRATTLMQLLTHRGGVRHYNNNDFNPAAPGGLIDFRAYPSNDAILGLFINDPLVNEPGGAVSYSTFGYTLASIVLEAAAQRPFLDLIRDEIAAPLALPTLAGDNPFAVVPGRVSGYGASADYQRVSPNLAGALANTPTTNSTYKWAGGGLVCSAADLARFGAAHLTPGRWSQASLDLLFTPQTQATRSLPPMGVGWRIDSDERGRLRWHHAGAQQGCRAALVIYPHEQLSIAFATNLTATPGDVLGPASAFADAALA